MPEQHQQSRSGSLAAQVSTTVVRLMSEYTGRGPTKARTTLDEELITCVLRDTLTKGERALVAKGNSDTVLTMRRAFQAAMSDDAKAAIAELTGREVIAFCSDNHIDPDMAIESFVLAPRNTEAAEGQTVG
jgi:uncharacterized protein YbcI